jgi:hypothetical protein
MLEREIRELSLATSRLDRPDPSRPGRIRRTLQRRLAAPARVPVQGAVPGIRIRPAGPGDGAELSVLAEISERRLPSGLVLVAEVGDAGIAAALPVQGGPVLTDIRRPTGDLVQLLELRSEQLRAGARRRAA